MVWDFLILQQQYIERSVETVYSTAVNMKVIIEEKLKEYMNENNEKNIVIFVKLCKT